MPRAIAIRASAVIALLGSSATLLLAGLILFSAFFSPPPNAAASPIPFKLVAIATAVFFLALAGWGVATGISIFRRQRWARLSMLVFGGLLALFSAISAIAVALVPLPPQPEGAPDVTTYVRWGIAIFYGVVAAIGVWWLVLFSRKRTCEYFTSGAPEREGARPLSITVIAWFMLITGACTLAWAPFRFPAVALGVMVKGWWAVGIYALYGAAELYLAVGLLRLKNWARLGSICFFALMVLNGIVFWSLPDPNGRMQAMLDAFSPSLRTQPDFPQFRGSAWAIISVIGTLPAAVVPIWFLVRRRHSFPTS